ncbi:MAG: class I SAM-dependent methyltransferase [Magnetospiraceae bacterium]
MTDAAARMDRMYRYQRYIYDLTRKYYLLGRDQAIAALQPPPGGTVLEIGCGTGRNLVKIAAAYPEIRAFGLDVSEEMLKTAQAAIEGKNLGHRVTVAQGDATRFSPEALFSQATFDRILFSFSLSMIPEWRQTLDHTTGLLSPSGEIHVVDFGNQDQLPRWFRNLLEIWLGWFGVHHHPGLVPAMGDLAARDAEFFAQTLVESCHFEPQNVQCLLDEEATWEPLQDDKTDEDDIVF